MALPFVRRLAVAAALLTILFVPAVARAGTPDLGPDVTIFDPSMSQADIQARLDAIAAQQVTNEFGTQRYAVFFEPGTYGSPDHPLNFQVGYYEQVAGLGARPGDVQLYGTADVYNQNGLALTNFWRSLENLTIDVAGKGGCQSGEFWAVSQASPMRRVDVNGQTTLMDYCTGPSYASGGFIADSTLGTVINGSQQQWLTRNSTVGNWTNSVWNQVFAGVGGAPAPVFAGNGAQVTVLPTNPESREAPFLYRDASGDLAVSVPAVQRDSAGPTWLAGPTPGRSVPLDSFYVAHPGDSQQQIDSALSRGLNLLFTPGVYDVTRTIRIKRADTIVLGLGLATLTAENGTVPMTVDDVPGVEISGLIFDAGPVESPVLLRVGTANQHGRGHGGFSDPGDPTLLADVFFRIGGPHVGKAGTALEVNSSDTILDDIWAWRADHGSGVGWTSNTADHGVVVNGDRVLATGLFVEHFQQDEVVWNGEAGETIFFQNEMPYDPPAQDAWQHDGILGYAAYRVAASVTAHQAWGMGSYCYFNVDPSIHATHAFEVPTTAGVRLHDVFDLSISNTGTIDHIVNETGPPTPPDTSPNDLVAYP